MKRFRPSHRHLALVLFLAMVPGALFAHEHPSHYSVTPQLTVLQDPDTMPYVEATGIPGADYTLQAAPDFGSWSDDAYPVELEPGHFAFFNEEPSAIENHFFRVAAERPDQNQINNQLPPLNFNPQLQQVIDLLQAAAEAAARRDEGVAMRLIQEARELYEQLARQGAVPGPFNQFARVILLNLLAQAIDAKAPKVWKRLCVRLIYIGNQGLTPAQAKKLQDKVTEGGALWRGACITFQVEEKVHIIAPATIKLTGAGFGPGDTVATFLAPNGQINLIPGGNPRPKNDRLRDGTGGARDATWTQFWKALKAALANHAAVKGSKCLNFFVLDDVISGRFAVPGYADQPGRFGMLTTGSSTKHVAHELGHLLGVPHSASGIMHEQATGCVPAPGDNGKAQDGAERAKKSGLSVTNAAQPVATPAEREQQGLPAQITCLERLKASVNNDKSFDRWKKKREAFMNMAATWLFNEGETPEALKQFNEWKSKLDTCQAALEARQTAGWKKADLKIYPPR